MTFARTILVLALVSGLSANPASASQDREGPSDPAVSVTADFSDGADQAEPMIRLAAADCSGAASRAARQTGGQVLSVSTRSQGGQIVCVVTVLVPGKGDQRPRKQTITIRP
ncbi:hypothetical protein LQ948_04595 [Jiella sp. MQZ9-1]|uniref:UrcA family protein n=1 Tax=Jiella flava TaxID=2816857 RepID=A0A939FXH8_9HYPH|nr:hypothetical protein [Jiella flava]MBO0661843.1 hypothetical protein [Jiella flava]MCD2470483.1 hypothetical protein [Jiella flava]